MSGLAIAASIVFGIALGLFFYGGLWWTVRRLPSTAHPVLLTVGSFWLRLIVALAAFVFVAKLGLASVACAAASFAVARLIVSRFLPRARQAAKCT